MLHPFAGILDIECGEATTADSQVQPLVAAGASRRSFLRRLFAGAAGLVGAGLLAGRSSAAQQPVLESGSGQVPPAGGGGSAASVQPAQYTIVRPRSQGSSITHWPRYQYGDRRPTTYALGEEGGSHLPPRYHYPPRYDHPPRRYTTYAFGQEGTVTTYALGEEGAYRPWRPPYGGGHYRPAPVTTYALGEEGGGPWRW